MNAAGWVYHLSQLVEFTASQSQESGEPFGYKFFFLVIKPLFVTVLNCCPLKVFSVSTQIWPVCSGPQSHQDWLPLHHASQSQGGCGEASDGDHARQHEAQPVRLLSQLHELRGLLCEQQAQPDRTGEPPVCVSLHSRHIRCSPPPSARLLCFRKGYTSPCPCMNCSFTVACERPYTFCNKREPKPLAPVQV